VTLYCAFCDREYARSEFTVVTPDKTLFANGRKLRYLKHKRCGGRTVWFATARMGAGTLTA
jgi:hypothetical protein